MVTKNAKTSSILGVFTVLVFASLMALPNSFAEEEEDYKMAENVQANFTFTFRDGIESYQFPVFKMTSDFISNDGTSFEIEGIIGKSPYLHKALDEAYKYRMMTSTGASSFEFNYKFFDVDVDLIRSDQTVRTLHYYNCEILEYGAVTLNSNDYESYTSSKTGFAVVDKIEFRCGGLNGESPETARFQNIDYGAIYTFAEDVRTFITFEFDGGVEKIEFTTFELNSGFEESDDSVTPSFSVEGVVDYYPLLYNAIDNARKVSGVGSAFNTDFEALVEFSNGKKTLRSLEFNDCRVSSAIINTETDKEEGFTGKSGFAIVNEIDFDCAGLSPKNEGYAEINGDAPVWKTLLMENEQLNDRLQMADGLRVMTTFTFDNGVEKLEFPIFKQGDVLSKANPTFELEGIVGDYPLLYKRVDENLRIQSISGANLMTELFDVDVNLIDGELVRGFNYSNCRVIDYDIDSDMNKEENYIKGQFALENTFDFECQGYHPNNPMYDIMFNSYTKSNTISSNDLRITHDWDPGFYAE
ncbi:MAG: hypothetical protein OEQ12_06000 [Nitrosopumilus sp.]|nr:hypothetical protein [Nitrosopumilus sp.]